VRIIQESKINDDENDGVETTTTQTRTFQKTLEFTRRFSTVKTPEQTSMLRDLLMGEHAVQMHEYECAAFSNLQPQDAHEAKTLIPSLGAKAAESGADRFSEPELASMVDQSANIRKFD
jgi:DNA-directed RNA polymerase II subunit RPB4